MSSRNQQEETADTARAVIDVEAAEARRPCVMLDHVLKPSSGASQGLIWHTPLRRSLSGRDVDSFPSYRCTGAPSLRNSLKHLLHWRSLRSW